MCRTVSTLDSKTLAGGVIVRSSVLGSSLNRYLKESGSTEALRIGILELDKVCMIGTTRVLASSMKEKRLNIAPSDFCAKTNLELHHQPIREGVM